MSPFCEVCEKPFLTMSEHVADCVICGQACCVSCITPERPHICKDCETSTSEDGKTLIRANEVVITQTSNDIQTR